MDGKENIYVEYVIYIYSIIAKYFIGNYHFVFIHLFFISTSNGPYHAFSIGLNITETLS